MLLLATAAVAARGFGDNRNGLLLAIVALVYAAVGGLLLFAGDRALADLAAPDLLVCAAAVVFVAAVAGSVAVAAYGQVFLAASAGAVALGVAAAICLVFGATPAGAASIVLALALVVVPAMPMMAYRLAGLPVPTVPSGTEDLRTDTETVDGARVLRLAERADDLLAGMLGAVGLIAAGSALALVTTGGTAGYALCAVLGLAAVHAGALVHLHRAAAAAAGRRRGRASPRSPSAASSPPACWAGSPWSSSDCWWWPRSASAPPSARAAAARRCSAAPSTSWRSC